MKKNLAEYRPNKEKLIPVHPKMRKVIREFHKIWYPLGHENCEYCDETKK